MISEIRTTSPRAPATVIASLALRPIRYNRDSESTSIRAGRLAINVLVVVVALIVVQGFGTVPTGHQGIVLRCDAATGAMESPDLYWVIPIRDDVEPLNVQIEERTRIVEAASSDLQDVGAAITVNYHVLASGAAKLYQEVVRDYRTAIIDPAIEDKVIAAQRALEAENRLRQVEFEAKQAIGQSKAEAEKIRIEAQAIQAQGGSECVTLQMIQAWDGSFPNTLIMSGEGGPFEILNLGDFVAP